jgi:chromosome segregation ATPase
MSDHDNRLLEVEKKVAAQEVLVSRFDSALDKISEVSLNVSRLLAVHEQRLETQEETGRRITEQTENRRKEVVEAHEAIHSKVNSVEQRLRTEMLDGQKEIMKEIKGLRTDMNDLGDELKDQNDAAREALSAEFDEKIDKVTSRVSTLERVQWIAIGGATVIGFLLSQALGLFQLLN